MVIFGKKIKRDSGYLSYRASWWSMFTYVYKDACCWQANAVASVCLNGSTVPPPSESYQRHNIYNVHTCGLSWTPFGNMGKNKEIDPGKMSGPKKFYSLPTFNYHFSWAMFVFGEPEMPENTLRYTKMPCSASRVASAAACCAFKNLAMP